MAVVKFAFTDPVTSDTYTFQVNPTSGGAPAYKKNITSENTTAPGGNVILYEGSDPPMEGRITGTILEEAQYQAFVTWWQKRYPVVMTDHLGRSFTIYITEFIPENKWVGSRPFRHGYELGYKVLSVSDL